MPTGNEAFLTNISLIFPESNFPSSKSKKNPLLKKFLMFWEMKCFSPKPKKLLIFKERILKAKNLLKVVFYDIFSIFISTEMSYKPCFNGYIRINRSLSFLYKVINRIRNMGGRFLVE